MTIKRISNGALADEIGELTRKAKHLEELLTAAKDEFKRRELYDVTGRLYDVHRGPGSSTYLDKAEVIKKLGAKWVDAHSRTVPYEKITARPLASAKLIKETEDASV